MPTALLLVFRRNALAALLVIVWAYAGIVTKRTQLDGDSARIVWIAAAAAAAALRSVSFNKTKRA
jgi:hypothetical protein